MGINDYCFCDFFFYLFAKLGMFYGFEGSYRLFGDYLFASVSSVHFDLDVRASIDNSPRD